MSEFAGIVQDELRDLRGNAMVGAVVRVREAGTSTPATLYDNPVQISAATGADALVNDATTGLPAASGLLMPGVDSGANYTFFADSDEEYDLLVTWNGLTFEYRVRPKVLVSGVDSIPPGTYVQVPEGIEDGEVPIWDEGTESWVGGTPGSTAAAVAATPVGVLTSTNVAGQLAELEAGVMLRGTKTTIAPVTVDTSGNDLVLAAAASRLEAVLVNTGAVAVTLGPSGVVAGAGVVLAPGEAWSDRSTVDAWHGVTASGSTTVSGYQVLAA